MSAAAADALSRLPGTPVRYLLQSSSDVPAVDDWLAPIERARLAQLRVPKRRDDWRLGRWTAKRAVAAALSVAPARIAVVARESGAPLALLDDLPTPLAVSLSHAAGRALCAVAPAGIALGCDLEVVAERDPAFARDILSPEEQAAAGDPRRLTLAWCAKEAVLKLIDEGLRADPRTVTVRAATPADAHWEAIAVEYEGRRVAAWSRAIAGLVAVVAFAPNLDRRSVVPGGGP